METPPPDPEAEVRQDLRHLKVYAIDSEDTMEVREVLSIWAFAFRYGVDMVKLGYRSTLEYCSTVLSFNTALL